MAGELRSGVRSDQLRVQLSRLRAQVMSLFGLRRGFFIQYDYASTTAPALRTYQEVEDLFAEGDFRWFIREMCLGLAAWRGVDSARVDLAMFPPLDALALCAAVRCFGPSRVIEVGSGSSTHYLAHAVAENGFGTVTCIDPSPRVPLAGLCLELIKRVMTEDDIQLCDALQAGDILFIDSSHIMLPGLDVDLLFNRVFPRLRPGVVVQLHDIFLPDDYPSAWKHRHYSEQNALVGWLVGGAFEIVFPGHYVATRQAALLDSLTAQLPGRFSHLAGSIWLRKR